jgi:hypothetical protein
LLFSFFSLSELFVSAGQLRRHSVSWLETTPKCVTPPPPQQLCRFPYETGLNHSLLFKYTISSNKSQTVKGTLALEKYTEAQGVKKAFVIEEALLHHLQALNELPADIVIPPRLIVSRTSGERVLERIEKPELPMQTMRELFEDD